jgi:molybdopterin converting factor small subunit
MEVQVLLFAGAREAAGHAMVPVFVPLPLTARGVLEALDRCVPELRGLLPACRLAVNEAYVPDAQPIGPADRLALIPPVSGG